MGILNLLRLLSTRKLIILLDSEARRKICYIWFKIYTEQLSLYRLSSCFSFDNATTMTGVAVKIAVLVQHFKWQFF